MGLSFADAFRRCIGEAVEYLSQVQSSAEESVVIYPIPLQDCVDIWPESWLRLVINKDLPTIDCVRTHDLNDDSEFYLPADLCVRRPKSQFNAAYKLSSGCAVDRTFDGALCKAIMEVIERDAVALWWYGGSSTEGGFRKISSRNWQSNVY